MRLFLLFSAIIVLPAFLSGQQSVDTLPAMELGMAPVMVFSTRVGSDSPVPHTNLNASDIAPGNLGQDIPYLLRWTPALVETSDAGNGIGYTGIRIRGSDPTRINITLNGIPLNDAESQAVYWVNLPDFSSSVSHIQIQRGAGTSTNGAGAFGATINLNTQGLQQEPFAILSNSIGSFNTLKHTVQLGTGLLNKHFALDGRLSQIRSDGFIDRASSNLRSWYLSGAWLGDRQSLRCNIFSGQEKTYQAWYGVPAQYIESDVLRTYNVAGTEKPGSPYENETDNYRQTHYQLIYNASRNAFSGNLSLHYTRGLGYYEQYKAGEAFADYGLEDLIFGDSTVLETDLIRRLWLDNHFLGAIYSLRYTRTRSELWLGGGWNRYWGRHFGDILWIQSPGSTLPGTIWYDNDAIKTDAHIYFKWNYDLNQRWKAFLDLQFRQVDYTFLGYNRQLEQVDQTVRLPFFNPKAGLNWYPDLDQKGRLYIFGGIARREPNRDDYVDSSPESRPTPEHMTDLEAGYEFKGKNLTFSVNGFWMHYRDQLVLTGSINDVGAATRVNVPESDRMGLELSAGFQWGQKWQFSGNGVLSRNKIRRIEVFTDNWDTGLQALEIFENTDIAFSPALTSAAQISYTAIDRPEHKLILQAGAKYVGHQYIDNTQATAAILPAYAYGDLLINYIWKPFNVAEIRWSLQVSNIWDARYSSNAWIYRFISQGYDPVQDDPYARREGAGRYNLTGYYPQAGRNYLLGMTVMF